MTDSIAARVRAVLDRSPVVDGHNDLLWALRGRSGYDLYALDLTERLPALHTDLPRLRAGGVGVQFWSVYVSATLAPDAAVVATIEQVDAAQLIFDRYPDVLAPARSAAEVDAALAAGRVASLLGVEGGHSIACSLAVLRQLAALGARYLTLTHNVNVPWADAATDSPAVGGLTRFGEEVVRELNRLGVLVDLSHVAADTMRAALRVSEAPVIFSHSSAYALCPHPRNVPDDVLVTLAGNGGVAMVTFVPVFLRAEVAPWAAELETEQQRLVAAGVGQGERTTRAGTLPRSLSDGLARWVAEHPPPRTTVADVADHVEHVREVAGLEHVGLGGDYDGTPIAPEGLADVSGYPTLLAELVRRGWSDHELALLTGENARRVLRAAEDVSRDLQHRRGPSFATIEGLDGPSGAAGSTGAAGPDGTVGVAVAAGSGVASGAGLAAGADVTAARAAGQPPAPA